MDAEAKIRVLIAEDSSFMRRVLKLLLTSDPQMEWKLCCSATPSIPT